LSRLAPIRVTLALLLICVAVYVAMVVTSGDPSNRLSFTTLHLREWGGTYSPALRDGQWWRLFTAMFVHASPDHIVFNMLALLQLGRYLEPRYAPARFLAVYLVGGLIGSAASAAFYWDTVIVQIGASGAIMALVGAGAVSAWRMGTRGRAFRNSMLIWGLVTLVNGALYSANNAAHLGGLASGALAVVLFGRRGRAALAPRERGGPELDDNSGVTCQTCLAANPRGSRFCGTCGASLVTLPVTP
jgi:rhomboid protease GluP